MTSKARRAAYNTLHRYFSCRETKRLLKEIYSHLGLGDFDGCGVFFTFKSDDKYTLKIAKIFEHIDYCDGAVEGEDLYCNIYRKIDGKFVCAFLYDFCGGIDFYADPFDDSNGWVCEWQQ